MGGFSAVGGDCGVEWGGGGAGGGSHKIQEARGGSDRVPNAGFRRGSDGVPTGFPNGCCLDRDRFFFKCRQYILRSQSFRVHANDPKQFLDSCASASHTAAGMDHFSPFDLSLITLQTAVWLCRMFDLIEAGSPWPQGLTHGKGAFLSKNEKAPYDPLQQRVLTLLATVYRRWANNRLKDVKEHQCENPYKFL